MKQGISGIVLFLLFGLINSFLLPSRFRNPQIQQKIARPVLDEEFFLFYNSHHPPRTTTTVRSSSSWIEPETWDDETLLQHVEKSQLLDLCKSLQLITTGKTKKELLHQLRHYAQQQAAQEKERILSRNQRVERGDDGREKYEIVNDDFFPEQEEDEEEDLEVFYFQIPSSSNPTQTPPKNDDSRSNTERKIGPRTGTTPQSITAPPPPKETNANGERVVQIYSTSDQNDLTGIAAAQPGQALSNAADYSMLMANEQEQPWDATASLSQTTSRKEMDAAKNKITELVSSLLAMSGAPAFLQNYDDEGDFLEKFPTFTLPTSYVGFDPSQVPVLILKEYSQSLRTGRGQILDEVLRQYEIQAIGQDGIHGDNVEKGGGHYREVSKVRAFLDGYRRAEVRRLARDTTALLLDKLVMEGVEGLDVTLSTMTRSRDDTASDIGELNDSLLDFLSDTIRSYEKKVGTSSTTSRRPNLSESLANNEDKSINQLWNVTMEDGQRIETIDPSDPKVRLALELAREEEDSEERGAVPDSPKERILLLLRLLRERVKAEAAFGTDEKGQNLKLLAYCLRVSSDTERKQLMKQGLGTSIDVSTHTCSRIGERTCVAVEDRFSYTTFRITAT